ncbi:hypothetical protein PV04_04021 [Phialophora macrospora]|uniref:Cas1p 10 TM acyl transferase domain-containing protein n=1 Tax=Phialophora macrospora TaxID=1851006 RepID=A0A0D2CSD2_9EURO|nr:hypothetical protein PV04_04021 [Phialophora macrospora]
MMRIRTPLLLLLCLCVCIPVWFILERIPQDEWLNHRCVVLSRGFPTPAEARNPPGCMLRSFHANDIRSCLTAQRMLVYGDVEAQQVFFTIAASLNQNHLTNTSLQPQEGYENATIIQSEMAQIVYQPDPAWNSTNYVGHSGLYAPLYITSSKREHPLCDEPVAIMGSSFAFNEESPPAPHTRAQIVLNYFCNGLLETAQRQTQAYCCAGYVPPNVLQKLLLLAGSCVILLHLFLSLLRRKLFRLSDNSLQPDSETGRVVAAVATTSAAVIICFVADRTALLEKASKVVDLTTFIILTSVAFLAGLVTCCHNRSPSGESNQRKDLVAGDHFFLSRQQTEEWKGWMQIVILFYHYFGLSKILWVYQFVRLLVSSYLFMTGFGHTTYFVTTNDFSYRRTASVLLRTNLLNIILAFVLGTRYDLYYFPMLTSVWFLIIWFTIPRTPESGIDVYHCTFRIILSAIFVTLSLEAGALVESLVNSLDAVHIGLPKIDGRELLFRFGLDVYIVHVGMATAILSSWLRARKGLPHHRESWVPLPRSRLSSSIALSAAGLVIPAYAYFCHAFSNKFQYNKWHPFVSPLPVMSFIILRNSTRRISSHYSRLFSWFGRCSLETFVLQYHLWLAADSRGVLRTGLFRPFYRSVQSRYVLELLDTTLIFTAFVLISSGTSRALSVLTRSLANLQAEIALVVVGMWMTNLAWSLTMLGGMTTTIEAK